MKIKTHRLNAFNQAHEIDTRLAECKDWTFKEAQYGVIINRTKSEKLPATRFLLPWPTIEWIDYGDTEMKQDGDSEHVDAPAKQGKR